MGKTRDPLPLVLLVAGLVLASKSYWAYQELIELKNMQQNLVEGALAQTENIVGRFVLYRKMIDSSVQFSKWGSEDFDLNLPPGAYKKFIEPEVQSLIKKLDTSYGSLKNLLSHQNDLLAAQDLSFTKNLKRALSLGDLTAGGEFYLSLRELQARMERSLENLAREQKHTLAGWQVKQNTLSRNLLLMWAFYLSIFAGVAWAKRSGFRRRFEELQKEKELEISHRSRSMQEILRTSTLELEFSHRRLDDLKKLTSLSDKILDSLDLALMMLSHDGGILRTNKSFWRMFQNEGAPKLSDSKRLFLENLGVDLNAMLAKGENLQLHELKGIGRLAGKSFDFNLQFIDLENAVNCLVIISDVTPRVELEERLGVAEKLSFMGKIASQMAHEIRNPLNALSLQLEMLEVSKNDSARLALIHGEIDRLNRTCDEYLNVSRDSTQRIGDDWSAKKKVEFQKVFEHSLNLMSLQLMAHGVEMDLNISQAMEEVFLPQDLARALQQILLNLVKNSMEAFTLDHLESVAHGGSTPPQRIIHIEAVRVAQNFLVRVSDNGPGVSQDLRTEIFRPFVTTKAKGHGLGLAVARELCRKFGGDLTLSVNAKNSACFEVSLPLQFFKTLAPKNLGERSNETPYASTIRAS